MQDINFSYTKRWARTNYIADINFNIINFGYDDFHFLKASLYSDKVPHNTFHLVLKGEGFLDIDGKTYTLRACDTFFLPANVIKFYRPNPDNPWQYVYFTMSGNQVPNLFEKIGYTRANPIYSCKNCAQKISDVISQLSEPLPNNSVNYYALSALYNVAALISDERQSAFCPIDNLKKHFSDMIKTCIVNNYRDPNFKVSTLCAMLFYSHTYLSRLFLAENGYTIQEYLIRYRMNIALSLMSNPNVTIKVVANSVGYIDTIQFSKIFYSIYHYTPTDYRKLFIAEKNILPSL